MGRELAVAAGVLAVVLAASALAPALVSARPAHEIPVHEAPDGAADSLADPGGDAWEDAVPTTVPLASAGAAVPGGDSTSTERVRVEVARTDARLYLRLSWADATRDASVADIRGFADAVAVQLPAEADSRPPIAMGGSDNLVNVWYWSADGASQELLAGGPGTTTSFPESRVATDATYADGRWTVVISRSVAAGSANRTAVPTDADMDVALAVWNGSNMERSGRKATSEWYYIALGPGPQGPPYETILWAVAGIAIVVTTLITVEGVRRTRGE